MKMVQPLVSICIPTFNGEEFISEALNSALSQTYGNIEIVVSDDNSSDRTLEIIKSTSDQHLIPIRIFHHNPSGIGANWNNCIRNANGHYIKFLFQDDVLMPDCVETLVTIFQNNEEFGLVASKREFLTSDSFISDSLNNWIKKYQDLQVNLDLVKKNGILILDKDLFSKDEFFNSPLNKVGEPSAILFPKEIVNIVGYFREDLIQVLDYEFYYRILKHFKIGIIEQKLVQFRLHKNQATVKNKGRDSQDYEIYEKIIYKDYLKYLNNKNRSFYKRKFDPKVRALTKIKKLLRNLC